MNFGRLKWSHVLAACDTLKSRLDANHTKQIASYVGTKLFDAASHIPDARSICGTESDVARSSRSRSCCPRWTYCQRAALVSPYELRITMQVGGTSQVAPQRIIVLLYEEAALAACASSDQGKEQDAKRPARLPPLPRVTFRARRQSSTPR